MARMGRMLLLARSTGDGPRNEGYGTRIEHEPPRRHDMDGRGSYGGYMGLESPPSYVQNNYKIRRDERVYNAADFDVEDRFRDRRGREHYDNGRYAPRSEYDEPESRRDSRGRYARSAYEEERPEHRDNVTQFVPPVYERVYKAMNPIGFVAGSPKEMEHTYRNDARYYPRSEMEGSSGHMDRGGASAQGAELDMAMAEEWMHGLRNEDGTHGAHWTMEQAKQVMAQRKIECDPVEFWVALNIMYSDYAPVFKKHGVGDRVDIYADMAKAFLEDKDAAPGKLAEYYLHVVQ